MSKIIKTYQSQHNDDIRIDIDEKRKIRLNIPNKKGLFSKKKSWNQHDFIFSNAQLEDFIKTLQEVNANVIDNRFKVQLLNSSAIMPVKSTEGSSGFDMATPMDIAIQPGGQLMIPMGFRIEIKPGYEIQARSRSSIPFRFHCSIPLGIGTIDSDYRGEIKVVLYNYGRDTAYFQRGERIAQLVIKKTENIELVKGIVSTKTERGTGGYGSTGK